MEELNKRREVFILGAGFSKETHQDMPTLKDLSERVFAWAGSPFQTLAGRLGGNLEHWLTYLAQPQPWLPASQRLRNQAMFLDLSQGIHKVLSDAVAKAQMDVPMVPEWLSRLVQHWHKEETVVISFNYDTLVEVAAKRSIEDRYFALAHIYAPGLMNAIGRGGGLLGSGDKPSFRLCKLHGSLNWYYSGSSSFAGENLFYTEVEPWGLEARYEQLGEEERRRLDARRRGSVRSTRDKVPLVIPPTTEKGAYFQHETLRAMWQIAGTAIRFAERIYCLGYSLPETDLGIRFFLSDNSPSRKIELCPVNPDPRMLDHYRALLGHAYEIRPTYVCDGSISKLVRDLCG